MFKPFKKPTLYKSMSLARNTIENIATTSLILKIEPSCVKNEGYYIGLYTKRNIFIKYL